MTGEETRVKKLFTSSHYLSCICTRKAKSWECDYPFNLQIFLGNILLFPENIFPRNLLSYFFPCTISREISLLQSSHSLELKLLKLRPFKIILTKGYTNTDLFFKLKQIMNRIRVARLVRTSFKGWTPQGWFFGQKLIMVQVVNSKGLREYNTIQEW